MRLFVQEVQSVVLETDDLESQEKAHANASFKILSQARFHWKQKTWVSHFKTIQNFKLLDWRFDEEMQPLALEKNSCKTKRYHTFKFCFHIIGLSNFCTTCEKKHGYWRILYTKKPIIDWDFDGTNPDRCFEGNWVWISRRIRPILNFWLPGRSGFRRKDITALLGNQVLV